MAKDLTIKQMEVMPIGTDDVEGAVVCGVDHDVVWLEKDGRKIRLEIEHASDYHSMCDSCSECGGCSCGQSGYDHGYFRAYEEK